MPGKNKTQTRISKEDYKRIRAKIKVKLRAYKINPDKAESYLERFKGLDIASIGEERIESLIKEEVGKSEDPSVLFELGVISEEKFDWRRKGAILDAMITLTDELKKKGKEIEDIDYLDLKKAGLGRLTLGNTLYDIIKMIKPNLKPWQLTRVPPGYWKDSKNVKEAVEWLVKEMAKEGKEIEEITIYDFKDMGLSKLLANRTLYSLLKMVKPDLKPWDLSQVPRGYWNDPKNVKEAVEWLVEEKAKEGKKIEEISADDFKNAGLSRIVDNNSIVSLLKMVKPDLKPWQLNKVHEGYWNDPKNVKEAVEWLVEKKVKEGKRIEEINTDDFKDAGLSRILEKNSIFSLLKMVKPDLKPWDLSQVPHGYWDDPKNVKEAVKWLVEEMAKEGKKIEEISARDFIDMRLGTLLYTQNLYDLLKLIKLDLKPWQLKQVPKNFWRDKKNVKEAVKWLVEEKAKEGKKIEEITGDDFKRANLDVIVLENGVYNLLKLIKPDLKPWQLKKVPNGCWDDPKNVKEAMEWFIEEMAKKGKNIGDITRQDFIDIGLIGLLKRYEVYDLLKLVKPDLKPWQLRQVPNGYWDDPKNVKEAVEWLVEEKAKEGKKIEEITQNDFVDAGLRTLINKYRKAELLRMVKPDYKGE